MNRLENRPAMLLDGGWIGSRIAADVGPSKCCTGVLSDYLVISEAVFLYVGGQRVVVVPEATVSRITP